MKKRVLSLLLLLLLAALPFSLSALAAEGTASAAEAAEANPFALFYQAMVENLDAVFGALAAVGTLAVAFSYKRGILPLLKGGVSVLSDKVKKIGEKSDSIADETAKSSELVKNNLQIILSELKDYENELSSLGEKLQSFSDIKTDVALLRRLLHGELELLYDIFAASALPQYQKERVTRRMEELTAALGGEENVS